MPHNQAGTATERELQARAEGDRPQQAAPGLPRCPTCGWQDVRLSRIKGVIDTVLGLISVSPFRCRSCGSRFYRHQRKSED